MMPLSSCTWSRLASCCLCFTMSRAMLGSTLTPVSWKGSLLGTERIVRQEPTRGGGGKPLRLRPSKTRRFRMASAWVGIRRKSKVLRHAYS
jgi:hypothetical protein